MKKLWKFNWDCGRMGKVEGVFIATTKQVMDLVGEELYFGEILGKHSEISVRAEDSDFEVLSSDQDLIDKLCAIFGGKKNQDSETLAGYNPLHYINDEVNDGGYNPLHYINDEVNDGG